MNSTTSTDLNTTTAEHIAAHFALDTITYDLRENDMSMRESDFTPAATAAELIDALELAQQLADSLPAGTPVPLPRFPVVIDQEGRELFVDIDRLTDEREQTNAVFVLLAEAVALRKASAAALLRAIGLREHCALNDHH